MWIVELALRRPYTFVVMSILIAFLGVFSFLRMPTDIFPNIDVPVVTVVWSYNGLPAEDMENRLTTICERAITTTTGDIEHIESSSISGISVIKIFLHQGADIGKAVSTISAICNTMLKIAPPGITPPLITAFSASDVPVLQLGVGGSKFSESELFDFGLNFIRTGLSGTPGAQIPLPFGGKMRHVVVDLDPNLMQAKGLSAADVAASISAQNVIIPSGSVKIGDTEYAVQLNSSPKTIDGFNDLPIKQSGNSTVYLKDVAHVHDGFAVQTNIVHKDGVRSTLINILKTGGASTIDVVKRVRENLPRVLSTLPPELEVTLLNDQSVFVRSAVEGVIKEAAIAAGLTALLILLLLASWRSTIIVAISIPLSILASIACLDALGQTLNTMTLGGLALAVGMLVDDATVEVENIHRNLDSGKPLTTAILDGAQQIAAPAFVSTMSICIVFVPVLFLTEPAKSLFVPLAMAVVFAMMFSYLLSRTLVPVMSKALLGQQGNHHQNKDGAKRTWLTPIYEGVDYEFERLRTQFKQVLRYLLTHTKTTVCCFLLLFSGLFCLFPFIGQDFFPLVDAGSIRIHVRTPTGRRIEDTEQVFKKIEDEIRNIVKVSDLDTIIDNIGLPTTGINLAYGDNITISNFDGEILVSLKKEHEGSTFDYQKKIRRMLADKFPECTIFFQPADIVSQILNASLPAPIDVQVTGRDKVKNYALALELKEKIKRVRGAVDVTLHQVMDAPELRFNVDRTKANQFGLTQKDIAQSVLISLSSSFQMAPSYWVNPQNGVNYIVSVSTPTHKVTSVDDIMNTVINSPGGKPQMLLNVASVSRGTTPAVVSHQRIQPVFDIFVNVQDRDLGGVMADINKILDESKSKLPRGSYFNIKGQAQSMNAAFIGLAGGLLFAVFLVYLLLVVNFHSWLDPFIILTAIPGCFAGIILALFCTQTTFSVPALMGAMMSVGVASANSILLISFANEELHDGAEPTQAALSAAFTRFRPVLMTAAAMIIGMLPMALGMGEGGSQNAPLGRAVIGGLLMATFATLLFVPCAFALIHNTLQKLHERKTREVNYTHA